MSAIRKQFYPDDDFGPGERAYLPELRSWLMEQPQDAWLHFALNANRDSMEEILQQFVETPDCDLAIAALIFWTSDPAYWLTQPRDRFERALAHRILANLDNGYYARADLALDETKILPWAQAYSSALKQLRGTTPPFTVPERLFGPFEGRTPRLVPTPDASTVAHLKEIHGALGVQSEKFWFE